MGRVMVRSSPQSPARAWTEEPGGYGGLVWARDRLLAYRLNIRPYTWAREEILAFDGPGRPRSLGRAAADLIALSPNGELALLSGPDQQAPQMGAVPAVARVVRVVDGSDVASLTPDPALARLYEGGVWIGDRVLTLGDNASVGATHPVVRPIVLRVTGGRIEVERFYLFPRHPTYQGPVGGIFARVRQPRFVDEAETRLGMWYRFGYSRSRYLECDLETGRCVLGSPATDMAGLGWPFLLENLSRPLGL